MGSDMERSLKIDMKADMRKENQGGESAKGYSGVIGGIYWVVRPPGFEPGIAGLGGRRPSPG
jgi:hypothetical protein